MSDMSTIYTKDPNIVARKIAGEMVLVPIRQNTGDLQCIFNLNEVAGRIWELIDAQRTMEDIVNILVEEYEVDPTMATADVLAFTAQLKAGGLITNNRTVPDSKSSD